MKPLRIGQVVRYVSATPFGNADLPAVVMSQHPTHTGIAIFADMRQGSEWHASTTETSTPTPGFFYRRKEPK